MAQESKFLTGPQAARKLGVTGQTVRQWVRSGRLPAVMLPSGHLRIAAEDVEAILQTRRTRRPARVARVAS